MNTKPEINRVYHYTNDVGYTHAVVVVRFNDKSVWLKWAGMSSDYVFRISLNSFSKYSFKDETTYN
jgi:hypothetical protein